MQYAYDAAGMEVSAAGESESRAMTYDGDGRRVKTVATVTSFDDSGSATTKTTTSYELRSSVPGGAVLVNLDSQGQRQRGYVYWGGEVVAWQEQAGASQSVLWEHRDSSGASLRVSGPGGVIDSRESVEADPSGMDAGLKPPLQLHQQRQREDMTYPGFADAVGSGSTECRIDGIQAPCSMAMREVNSGAAGIRSDGGDSASLNIKGAMFVPDYGDNSHDYYDPAKDAKDAVVGVIVGQFESTGEEAANTSLAPQHPTPTPTPPQVSPECQSALDAINKNAFAIQRAYEAQDILNQAGDSYPWVVAHIRVSA